MKLIYCFTICFCFLKVSPILACSTISDSFYDDATEISYKMVKVTCSYSRRPKKWLEVRAGLRCRTEFGFVISNGNKYKEFYNCNKLGCKSLLVRCVDKKNRRKK